MGTTLTGTQINNTYDGLIKTTDNTAITATTKLISDGLGNDTCIKVGTAGTDFLGAVDFSSATVSGLPDNNTTYDLASAQAADNVNVNLTGSDATTDTVTLAAGTNITLTDNGSNQITIDAAGGGAAGLESGSGAGSMQSAASLTTTPANASGCNSIVLGDAAADTSSGTSVYGSIVIGYDASSNNQQSLVLGQEACSLIQGGVAIGLQAKACGNSFAHAIGRGSIGSGYMSIALGPGAQSQAGGFGCGSVALGNNSISTAICSVALGAGVTASRVSTATAYQLEACEAGKGIVVTSPDGLTTLGIGIDNTGAIVTYTP